MKEIPKSTVDRNIKEISQNHKIVEVGKMSDFEPKVYNIWIEIGGKRYEFKPCENKDDCFMCDTCYGMLVNYDHQLKQCEIEYLKTLKEGDLK